ncbi:DUF262 domain-containing protein [Helicobacter pylori]|uniref:DUF262 domain-containing protein n=1 Tax=Helicobacter pylori TaxID=210 RepID=UPI002D80BC80|nr:DUF262 domain-containing protein [Helicobacter pylori]
MRVTQGTINDFFALTGTIFSIPAYQRNYTWEEENCEKLLQDIINISQNQNKKTHFMGSITYILHLIDDEKSLRQLQEFVIIDGQQRITTLMLLLKAIETKIPNEEIKKEIDNLLNLSDKGCVSNPLKATKKPLIWSCKIDRMNYKAYHTLGIIINFSPKSLKIISAKGIA